MFQLLTIYISLVTCCRLIASDYYVSPDGSDDNTGKINSPLKTIEKAVEKAVPGSTIFIKEGKFNEKILITKSGEKNKWITIRPFKNNKVVIDATGLKRIKSKKHNIQGDAVFYLTECSYIRIEGLEICNAKMKDGSGIRLYGSVSNVEILNNKIHDMRGKSAMGITLYGASKKSFTGISDILIQGNEIYDCDPAPSEALVANGDVRNFRIINNHVHDVNNIGIDAIGGEKWLSTKFPSNGVISRNLVERCFSCYEDGYAAGIYSDGASKLLVENNVVRECDLGIEIGAENKGVVTKNVKVEGNIIYNNYKTGIVFGGYNKKKTGYVSDCTFENNILFKNNRPNDKGPFSMSKGASNGEIWVQYAKENVIRSNIVYASKGINNLRICWEKGYDLNNSFENNTYFTEDGAAEAIFVINGKEYQGINAYKKSNMEKNPIFKDPKLTKEKLDKQAALLFKTK